MTKEEIILLRRPFALDLISFKPGHGNADKKAAFAHADPRAYQDRMNEVFGDRWDADTTVHIAPDRVICTTTVAITQQDGRVTKRTDVGEQAFIRGQKADENAATTARAQSFKRACSQYGCGQYLYELDKNAFWGNFAKYGFTDEAVEDFYKKMSTPEQRFWTAVENKKLDLWEIAKRIGEGQEMKDIFNELSK